MDVTQEALFRVILKVASRMHYCLMSSAWWYGWGVLKLARHQRQYLCKLLLLCCQRFVWLSTYAVAAFLKLMLHQPRCYVSFSICSQSGLSLWSIICRSESYITRRPTTGLAGQPTTISSCVLCRWFIARSCVLNYTDLYDYWVCCCVDSVKTFVVA